jgi:opacity protein-like surface antigen
MRRLAVTVAFLLLPCLSPAAAHAQFLPRIPLSIEARGGVAIPTGDFADETPGIEAESGSRFGVSAALRLPALSVFGGYSQARFGCPRCGERGLDDEVVDDGFDFGIRASVPFRVGGLAPWVQAGGVLHQLTFSGLDSSLSSDRALGFSVGGGIVLSLIRSLAVTPGVHYSAYSAELDLGGLPGRTVDVTHFTADVGLAFRF